MALDATLADLLSQAPPPDVQNQTVATLRRDGEAAVVALGAGAPDVHEVLPLHVSGPQGELALRLYRPNDRTGLPVLVLFHGGGWVAGSLASMDPAARRICRALDSLVLTVSYRLAPENPFPAAFDDALAATRWVLDNISDHGGDPARVAIGGDSAGGNLAAAVAGALHDAGDDRLIAQLLLYPALDPSPDEHASESWRADADPTLPVTLVHWCIESYLQGWSADDLRVSPGRRADLTGLPPAIVAVAPADPFYDQGVAYVAGLRSAGVPAELVDCTGLVHGFANFVDQVPAAARAFAQTMSRLQDLQHAGVRA